MQISIIIDMANLEKTQYFLDAKKFLAQPNVSKQLAIPVFVTIRNKGEVKWVANKETMEVVYSNLKRSVSQKTAMDEVNKLLISFSQNKFKQQFAHFVKYFSNTHTNSGDYMLGNCPKYGKKIPHNKHHHTVGFYVSAILDWYVEYYTWLEKLKESKRQKSEMEDKNGGYKEEEERGEKENEISIQNHDEVADEIASREIPDSWDV